MFGGLLAGQEADGHAGDFVRKQDDIVVIGAAHTNEDAEIRFDHTGGPGQLADLVENGLDFGLGFGQFLTFIGRGVLAFRFQGHDEGLAFTNVRVEVKAFLDELGREQSLLVAVDGLGDGVRVHIKSLVPF